MRLSDSVIPSVITLDRASNVPLYRQLYDSLRTAILNGQLESGLRLPSTRELAELLNVSRNTVLNAVNQMLAEGYLEAKERSGIYVTSSLPEELMAARQVLIGSPHQSPFRRRFSSLSDDLSRNPIPIRSQASHDYLLKIGLCALDQFPFRVWSQITTQCYREHDKEIFNVDASPAGYMPLREAICRYLTAARAVRCTPEQVIVVSGSQQALTLAALVLLNSRDEAWLEEPGYTGARGAFQAAGARIVPIPVDEDGIDVDEGIARAAWARLAYVTPSHQFPTGSTLSLTRRFKLLHWAEVNDSWIIEDDVASEFRYSGPPLASLQGLDISQRVIYTGTFSKVLFPGIRIGYLVVPPDLVDRFIAMRYILDLHSPLVPQATISVFMREGHFTRHIRRMRTLYNKRRILFLETIRQELKDLVTLGPSESGMYVVCWLPEGIDDREVFIRAAELGVEALPISRFSLEPPKRSGVILGYTGDTSDNLRLGIKLLRTAILDVMG